MEILQGILIVLFVIFCMFQVFGLVFSIAIFFNDNDNVPKKLVDDFFEKDTIKLGELLSELAFIFGVFLVTIILYYTLKPPVMILVFFINKLAKFIGKLFKKPVESFKELMEVEVKIPKFTIKIEKK